MLLPIHLKFWEVKKLESVDKKKYLIMSFSSMENEASDWLT